MVPAVDGPAVANSDLLLFGDYSRFPIASSGMRVSIGKGGGEVKEKRTRILIFAQRSLSRTLSRTRAALSRLIERSSRRPSTGATRKFKLKFISALHFGRVASLLDELLRTTMFPRYIRTLFLDAQIISSFSLSFVAPRYPSADMDLRRMDL